MQVHGLNFAKHNIRSQPIHISGFRTTRPFRENRPIRTLYTLDTVSNQNTLYIECSVLIKWRKKISYCRDSSQIWYQNRKKR